MAAFPPPKRHPYDQWSPDARALDLVGDKWTLLIVRDLAAGPRRFVELQRVLPGHLDRAAALAAEPHGRRRPADPPALPRGAAARGLRADRARPGADAGPRRARPLGLRVGVERARATARRSTSARSCGWRPGMLEPPKSLSGSVAMEATGKHSAPRTYLLTARRGNVTVEEHDDEDADARVSGPQKAWIAAFGPDASRSGLKIEGNKKLAEALLDELAQVASSGRAAASA